MEKSLKYFLAANSAQGFVSYFADCYNPNDNWKAYIIKGGPGTGKSSFMRKIAKTAKEKGEDYILCPCSSDPHSLDAVILPEKKQVVMDGTAPHTLDPRYPAVCEEILNFGQFWDVNKIKNNDQIIKISNQNKNLHKTASNYLKAAGEILLDSYNKVLLNAKTEKAEKFAHKLCDRYINQTDNNPYEWKAFLSGTTPSGIVSYPETITQNFENIIIISDCHRAVSNLIINNIKLHALKQGFEITAFYNPLLPMLCDHIIIPKLSLGFVTEDRNTVFDTNVRRIHARRFLPKEKLTIQKQLKLNQKITDALLLTATNTLKEAKSIHDNLESFYINAMDFGALNKFCEDFCDKLFS